MNNKVDPAVREAFRDFLRAELRDAAKWPEGAFYQRRGDHYLIREFRNYAAAVLARQDPPIEAVDEASLGRYLRDDEPVLPTPERCRAIAIVLGYPALKVLKEAGYVRLDDLDPDGLASVGVVQDAPATKKKDKGK